MQRPQLPQLPYVVTRAPRDTLATLAGIVRGCLAELARCRGPEPGADPASVVVTAAPLFAANPYARARLLRQLHACGLLSDGETQHGSECVGVAQ